jgi:lysophospholipase L1-like esterase
VIERQLPELAVQRPEFVSLLVGVNDVVREVPLDTYAADAGQILDELLARTAHDRAVVVSTPDYTVTPQGAAYGDPVRRSAGIVQMNGVLADLAKERRIAFVDVHDLSLEAGADRSLVASDGLHPSGHQYARWVDRIEPVVRSLLIGPRGGGVGPWPAR